MYVLPQVHFPAMFWLKVLLAHKCGRKRDAHHIHELREGKGDDLNNGHQMQAPERSTFTAGTWDREPGREVPELQITKKPWQDALHECLSCIDER
eukprot:1156630-Pelagomonas_calceolata.AAC.11